jgi:hypothetical protein
MRQTRNLNAWGRLTDELDYNLGERWRAIMQRCYDPSSCAYANYGARGIKVHPDFHNKVAFVDYLRNLPNASVMLEIDRIDFNGDYAPGNLRFATRQEQTWNMRTTVFLDYKGVQWPARKWAKLHSRFSPQTVTRLARRGLSGEEILQRENGSAPGLRPRKRWRKTPVLDGELHRS